MKTVAIPGGRTTSQLGFGCALLAAGAARRESLRLLGAALDAGITHFDVAPSYGFGLAEDVVGEFAQGRRGEITITTKVGLSRPAAPGPLIAARAMLRPLLGLAPSLRRRLGGAVYRMSVAKARFETAEVEASLAESLRRLRTERVDLLLLHELTPADVTDELRRFTEDAVRSGKAGACGVGSPSQVVAELDGAAPDLTRIAQTNWSIGEAALAARQTLLITHGSLRKLGELSAWLHADADRLARLSKDAGADLADPAILAELALSAALARNPAGVVLVATRQPVRIAAHARLAADDDRQRQAIRLDAALRRERGDAD